MKKLLSIEINRKKLVSDLNKFEEFLKESRNKKERDDILKFFKGEDEGGSIKENLITALGLLGGLEVPNQYAVELSLFGDFSCDAASGDGEAGDFTLIEFEDAQLHSVFGKLPNSGGLPKWSQRFEHGFSQLVDWAWRISSETNTDAVQRVFGCRKPHINFMLIIGRSAELDEKSGRERLNWRSKQVSFGAHKMTCLTFDDVLHGLRRRLKHIDPL